MAAATAASAVSTGEPPRDYGSFRGRLTMYTLQCTYIAVIKTVRAAIREYCAAGAAAAASCHPSLLVIVAP